MTSTTTLGGTDTLPGYRAALEGAAVRDESDCGRIEMRDRDRAALLHRLSTNAIEGLRPGHGARTVLTNHNGRIIDLLCVYALDDALLLTTSPGQGPAVLQLLRKNIFFNDKVKLADQSASLGQLALFGPRSGALLAELGAPQAEGLPEHGSAEATLAGVACRVARSLPLGGQGWRVFAPREALEGLRAALEEAGAAPLSDDAYGALLVEEGYGAFGRELSLEYIPLETGLRDAISFTKGCYVGQEIIARMDSRNRLAKQLRGLRLSALPDAALPLKLAVDGKDAGDLTSAALSPRFGPIALAYVRSAHAAPGTAVGIAGSDAIGTVVELPFAD
jgi:tRNA-modifying protein YgfZ